MVTAMCRPCLPCTPHQWLTYGPLSTVQVFAFLREWLGRDEAWCSEGERLLWAITHAAAHTLGHLTGNGTATV
jgi:hypothetical protein